MADPHHSGRTVGQAGPALSHKLDLGGIEIHAVDEQHVWPQKSRVGKVFHDGFAVALEIDKQLLICQPHSLADGIDDPTVGRQAVDWTAEHAVDLVDELLGKKWDRRKDDFSDETEVPAAEDAAIATCSCGSGIPVQTVHLDGQAVTLIALRVIFQQFREQGKVPGDGVARELLNLVKVYNPVPAEQEANYLSVLEQEYTAFCARK